MKNLSLIFLWVIFFVFLIGQMFILANVNAIAWMFLIQLFALFDIAYLFIAIGFTFFVGAKKTKEIK